MNERCGAAQKPFLIRIQNSDQRAFRNIQAFAQQIDADQHIKNALAQIADDFDAFQRVNIRMQIAHADAGFCHVFGQVFGHALGECSHQHAPAMLGDFAAFRQKIIHLLFYGPDFRDGINQARWADHLFGKGAAGAFHLPRAGGGADEDGIRAVGIPFLKLEGAVIRAAWQAEAVFGKHGFARIVAAIHAANLRHRDMAFIHDQQSIVR